MRITVQVPDSERELNNSAASCARGLLRLGVTRDEPAMALDRYEAAFALSGDERKIEIHVD